MTLSFLSRPAEHSRNAVVCHDCPFCTTDKQRLAAVKNKPNQKKKNNNNRRAIKQFKSLRCTWVVGIEVADSKFEVYFYFSDNMNCYCL